MQPVGSSEESGSGEAAPSGRASTPERILDAALARFADRGVEATSLDSLAVEVGVRKQTILYWFPSKEQLLFGVIDHAVARLAAHLGAAAADGAAPIPVARGSASIRRRFDGSGRFDVDSTRIARSGAERLPRVVDATFRLGSTDPALLAVVREVARLGPPVSTHLAEAVAPLVDAAATALAGPDATADELDRLRQVLLAAGARVVGLATEAEVRADLGLPADVAWLRARRRELLAALGAELG